MRLTLRTLLAYRDGVLSPADTEDLHQRIQKSHDAAKLLQRIEEISCDIQGASPTIVGKGFDGDPNYLAEYLDDSLHGRNVPEMERVCLESNVRLAELAACHRLLATALHTRVVVPDALHALAVAIGSPEQRERIKNELQNRKQQRLLSAPGQIVRAHPAHSTADQSSLATTAEKHANQQQTERAVQVQAPMVASGGDTIKPQGLDLESTQLSHEVPEYLMGRNTGAWRIPLAILALIVLLALLVWQALGPWDRIMALLTDEPPVQNAPQTPSDDQREPTPAATPDKDAADPNQNRESSLRDASSNPENTTEQANPATANAAPLEANAGAENVTGGADAAPSTPTPAPNQGPETQAAAAPTDARPPSPDNAAEPPSPASIPAGATLFLPEQVPADFEQVVLAVKPEGQIARLPVNAAIEAGTRLLVPPYFHPRLRMPSGLIWQVAGPSRLELNADGVQSSLFRALLTRTPEGGNVRITTPQASLEIVLPNPDSMAAVEAAYRFARHGSLLEAEVMQPVLVVVAVEGTVQVRIPDGNEAPVSLALGEGLGLTGNEAPEKFKLQNIPAWYRGAMTRPIDAEAAQMLADTLQPIPDSEGTNLLSLCESNRPELAALAIQTMLLLDRWQPLLDTEFLADPRQSIHWDRTIDLAQQVFVAEPTQADTVKALFEGSGPQGEEHFQLFLGVTEQELADNGLSRLVAKLDENDLASRVLAYYQLYHLTGQRLGFKPHVPNRASIQMWRRELATGRLNVLPVRDTLHERLSP